MRLHEQHGKKYPKLKQLNQKCQQQTIRSHLLCQASTCISTCSKDPFMSKHWRSLFSSHSSRAVPPFFATWIKRKTRHAFRSRLVTWSSWKLPSEGKLAWEIGNQIFKIFQVASQHDNSLNCFCLFFCGC